MDLPELYHAGVYTHAQKDSYVTHGETIGLYVSGRIWSRSYDTAGNLIVEKKAGRTPDQAQLTVGTPGTRIEFEFGTNRENWVIQTHFKPLEYDPATKITSLNYNGTKLPVPRAIDVDETEVITLRNTFRTIMEYFESALPQNILAAEIMTLDLFRRFLEKTDIRKDDIVERFRKNLDLDEQWKKNLDQHCRSLGVCRDTMRKAFIERYKIAPGEYRMRKRLQRIMHLFMHSQLTLKEIAFAVGMKNVTHLNGFLKAYYGKTPSQLCRKYRSGSMY